MNIYLICALVIALYMTILFVVALYKKDTSIIDIGWGPGFILVALSSLILNGHYETRSILVTVLTCVWALRITAHLAWRHRSTESRYTALRTLNFFLALRNFMYIYLLQAIALFVIAIPIVFITSTSQPGITYWDILGTLLWTIGMIFETVGDYQLALFLQDDHNRGRVMTKGLWKYTRHPNYFGEALIWWGIFCIALSLPHGFLTIISPLTITLLLRYVSGVPLIEKMFEHNREYEMYKESTSTFFPWFPFTEEDIA